MIFCNQIKTSIKKDTGNIFESVTYTHAGEYVYTVAETQNVGWAQILKNSVPIDSMTYDNRNYEMHVIVKKISKAQVFIFHLYISN